MASPAVDSQSKRLVPELKSAGRRCSTCDHPAIKEINEALVLNQKSTMAIARNFAVSEDSLQRHRNKCVPLVLESERKALTSTDLAESLTHFAVTAKSNRIGRIEKILTEIDKIVAERGLILRRTTTITSKDGAGRETVDEIYNRDLATNVIELHNAVRQELGETQAASRGGNNTVVFMPGSLTGGGDLPTAAGARGLLAEAAAAAEAALGGPPRAAAAVSLEGRRPEGSKPACNLPTAISQTDVEFTAEPVTEGEDTRER